MLTDDFEPKPCLPDKAPVEGSRLKYCGLENRTVDEATAVGGKGKEGSTTKSRTLVEVKVGFVGSGVETAGDFADRLSVASGWAVVGFALPDIIVAVASRLSVGGEDVEPR